MDQKVLIVDGHPVYAQRVITFLQGLMFTDIHLAKTGKQGMDDARDKKPDLVILSSVLPDMDSSLVCREIHALTKGASKIIVQIGLFTEAETVNKFHDHGASAVLMRKEKDLQPLQKAIERLLLSEV
ncbi:MAG: response regulator [Candidatus Omnitrophica bacterium]|nr:response regulator [Candidatus Omnitrophota bacterium]